MVMMMNVDDDGEKECSSEVFCASGVGKYLLRVF
jgi:hypothetical protein